MNGGPRGSLTRRAEVSLRSQNQEKGREPNEEGGVLAVRTGRAVQEIAWSSSRQRSGTR